MDQQTVQIDSGLSNIVENAQQQEIPSDLSLSEQIEDSNIELLFGKQSVSEFLEVTLEGEVDSVEFKASEPKSGKPIQQQISQETIAPSIVEESQPILSDLELDLLFKKEIPDEFLEVILEGAIEDAQLSVKEPRISQLGVPLSQESKIDESMEEPRLVEEPLSIDSKVEERSTVSDSEVDLLFGQKTLDESLEVVLEGKLFLRTLKLSVKPECHNRD